MTTKKIINPSSSRSPLMAAGVPYTAMQKRYVLDEHVQTIECEYLNARQKSSSPTLIIADDQIDFWIECLKSASLRKDSPSGWTFVISGPSSIAAPEAAAAQLASEYLYNQRNIKWINVNSSLSGQRSLEAMTQPLSAQDISAYFFSGLRWDASDTRFDKTFDLLRETPHNSDRILIGCGNDPLAIARRLNIPVQRLLYVSDTRSVQM